MRGKIRKLSWYWVKTKKIKNLNSNLKEDQSCSERLVSQYQSIRYLLEVSSNKKLTLFHFLLYKKWFLSNLKISMLKVSTNNWSNITPIQMMKLLIMLIWGHYKNSIELSIIWPILNSFYQNYILLYKDSKILAILKIHNIDNKDNYLEANLVWTLVS